MLHEWAYTRPYVSERLRRRTLPKWLHIYNHHRAHTALGSRVTNLSGCTPGRVSSFPERRQLAADSYARLAAVDAHRGLVER